MLDLVGAGGIGVVLSDSMNLFEWLRVAIALLAIFVVVTVVEIVVVNIHKRLI
ncbi:hypothetical protein [Marinomonas sp. 2405UD68-3]|uniref:hypothetical protein n=1 Tax=Marinomonas sp. 2405UD68-3 TaxID=3391835 RepID=UPI0039C989AB